jgi:hypothetical protein
VGAFLQIRVSAVTADPAKVKKAWPQLVRLAYPVEATPSPEGLGVLELVATLEDRVRLDDIAVSGGFDPRPGIRAVAESARKLEEALASRNPQAADSLSYAIEDALSELERGLG